MGYSVVSVKTCFLNRMSRLQARALPFLPWLYIGIQKSNFAHLNKIDKDFFALFPRQLLEKFQLSCQLYAPQSVGWLPIIF